MKKRLNILCLLVMLVLVYSVFESTYNLSSMFMSGVRAGMEQSKDKVKLSAIQDLKIVALMPNDLTEMKDSVYNEKSGEYVPALYSQLLVSVKSEPNIWLMLVANLSSFCYIFVSLFSVIIFFKLIVSINKSDIFNWKNVRRLRWLGILLVLTFLFSATPSWIMAWQLSGIFSVSGYSFSTSELISTLTLVLGLVSLIVGEVFAIGLRMKEEQDLTI